MGIMLLAQGQGWHSFPMDGFDFDAVRRLISPPEGRIASMMIVEGSRSKESFQRTDKLPLDHDFFENSF